VAHLREPPGRIVVGIAGRGAVAAGERGAPAAVVIAEGGEDAGPGGRPVLADAPDLAGRQEVVFDVEAENARNFLILPSCLGSIGHKAPHIGVFNRDRRPYNKCNVIVLTISADRLVRKH
jgi:hypothetical protein